MVLQGKSIAFLGDSITEGTGVSDILNNRYDNVLKHECKLSAVYNYGIGGTRLAHQEVPSEKPRYDLCFCGRAYNIEPSADIIIVYGGVNDYIHGDAPFGNYGDTTPATYCGGVWFLMNFLKATFIDKPIVFMTPAKMKYNELSCYNASKRPMKKPDAKPLIEYVKAIINVAKTFDIPVLNLYDDLGIDPNIEEDKLKFTDDGLHFNDAGHKVIATKLKEFLENL